MSIQQRNEIEDLKRRVATLEQIVTALRDKNTPALDQLLPRPTLTLPEKRKSA